MAVAERLKTALDESCLLIMGAQVLFGFQFEAVDVAVVFYKATGNESVALASGVASLLTLLGLWLGYPFWRGPVLGTN